MTTSTRRSVPSDARTAEAGTRAPDSDPGEAGAAEVGTAATKKAKPRIFGPLLEGLALLVAVAGANYFLAADDPGLVRVAPHPIVVVTLLIVVRYGFVPGVCMCTMSVAAYSAALLTVVKVPTFLHLLSAPYSTPVVVVVPMTIVFGILTQKHLDALRKTEAERARLAAENTKIQEEQSDLREVNIELADKVVGAGETLSTLYRYAKDLNVNDVEQIYQGLAKMLSEVVEAETVSVWIRKDDGLNLATRAGREGDIPPLSIDERLEARFDKHGILSVHDVPEPERTPGLPYVTGKLTESRAGPFHGYLTIDRLPFARYTPETIRLFMMTTDWASQSIGNALAFHKLTPAEREQHAEREQQAARPKGPFRSQQSSAAKIDLDTTGVETSNLGALLAAARVHLQPAKIPPPAKTAAAPQRRDSTPAGDLVGQIRGDLSQVVSKRGTRASQTPSQSRTGLHSLLNDADRLLSQNTKRPVPHEPTPPPGQAFIDKEVLEELEYTRAQNAPLGNLLGEIGDYLANVKGKQS